MNEKNKEQEVPTIFWRIEEWFPEFNGEIKARLKNYHRELIKINRSVSLISPKTIFVADALHFADSILACRLVMESNQEIDSIYDFGSGSGFPGLIFAILYPKVQVTLVEIDARKCEFLNHIINVLELKNVTVENKSIEALSENSVKFAICRGLGNISKAILLARRCMQKGGIFFQLKSEEWGIEVGGIPSQLCSVWSPSLLGEYKLPVGAIKFAIIKTEKIA